MLIFTGKKVLHYEIKAYKDPVIYKGDIFEIIMENPEEGEGNANGEVITYKNPIEQLKENRINLAQLFQKLNIKLPIESYVIFAHPNYYIHELPAGEPFVFRGQLQTHIEKVKQHIYPATEDTQIYVRNLERYNKDTSKEDYQLPNYTFESLSKILLFPCCKKDIGLLSNYQKFIECHNCHKKYAMKDIGEYARWEFQNLFGQEPTLMQLYHWCDQKFSKPRLHTWFYKKKSPPV